MFENAGDLGVELIHQWDHAICGNGCRIQQCVYRCAQMDTDQGDVGDPVEFVEHDQVQD